MRIEFDFACKDYCLDRMVPSDLRQLVCERDNAEKRIRELEEVLQEAIYANPFSRPGWINRAKQLLKTQRSSDE